MSSACAPVKLALRLYVSGDAPYSAAALRNLQSLCDRHLAGQHSLEVVDVIDDPTRCLQDSITATPTLVKVSPAPRIEIAGDLADTEKVLSALSATPDQAGSKGKRQNTNA